MDRARQRVAMRGHCDGHHKMSEFGAAREPAHRGRKGGATVWPHQRRMVHAGSNGDIMSKTNDTKTRELTEAELNAVSGGGGLDAASNEVALRQKKYPVKISYDK